MLLTESGLLYTVVRAVSYNSKKHNILDALGHDINVKKLLLCICIESRALLENSRYSLLAHKTQKNHMYDK